MVKLSRLVRIIVLRVDRSAKTLVKDTASNDQFPFKILFLLGINSLSGAVDIPVNKLGDFYSNEGDRP